MGVGVKSNKKILNYEKSVARCGNCRYFMHLEKACKLMRERVSINGCCDAYDDNKIRKA